MLGMSFLPHKRALTHPMPRKPAHKLIFPKPLGRFLQQPRNITPAILEQYSRASVRLLQGSRRKFTGKSALNKTERTRELPDSQNYAENKKVPRSERDFVWQLALMLRPCCCQRELSCGAAGWGF